jgi:hypothetical protein
MKYSKLFIPAIIIFMSSCSTKVGQGLSSSETNTSSARTTNSLPPIEAQSSQSTRKEATTTTNGNAASGKTEIAIPSSK